MKRSVSGSHIFVVRPDWICWGVIMLIAMGGILSEARGNSERPEQAPPLIFVKPERLRQIRDLSKKKGSVHAEILAAMRARIEPGDPLAVEGSYPNYRRAFFAREAAWLFLVTGEKRFAQAAYSALRDVYDSTQPEDHARPDSGSGLQRAQTIAAFGTAWNWAWTGWTPEQRLWVEEKINAGLNNYDQALRHPNIRSPYVSNWNGVVAGGHIIALAGSNTWRKRRADFESSAKILTGHLASLGDRGWLQEGPGYLCLSMENALPAALILRDLSRPEAARAVIDRNLHQLFLYAGGFDSGQRALNWGVGAGYFPPGGTTNALLGLVPAADLPYYKWFYDRHRGPANPAPAVKKYDLHGGWGSLAMIYYPEEIEARDPAEAFPPAILDNQGGFLVRSRWRDAGDLLVGLWTDAVARKNAWDQGDALHLNVLTQGVSFGLGPGPVTTPDARTFSSLLVDGKSPPVGGRGKPVSLSAGKGGVYAVADGDKAYEALGVRAQRHLLVDFNAGGPALLSTLDVVDSPAPRLFAWNLYTPGLQLSTGTQDGLVWVQAESPEQGTYLRAWAMTPQATARLEKDSMRLEWSVAKEQLWVICEIGQKGFSPSQIELENSDNARIARIAGRRIEVSRSKPALMSEALAGLRPLADPLPRGLSAESGRPPLQVAFSALPAPAVTTWEVNADPPLAQPEFTFEKDGLHTVVATARDEIGVLGRRAAALLVGAGLSDLRIEGMPANALPGQPVQLRALGDNLSGATLEWDLGDGSKATGQEVTHSWKEAGNYGVILTAKTPDGAEAVASARIRVENLKPTARLQARSYGGMAPFPVVLDGSRSIDPEGDKLTYRWDFADGTPELTTETPEVRHTYSRPGTYQATLTVTDSGGQKDSVKGPLIRVYSPDEQPMSAVELPKSHARGLNYAVFQCPVPDGQPPDLSLYSPAREGRVANMEIRVSPFSERYAISFDGYLHAAQTGIYEFLCSSFGEARLILGGQRLLVSDRFRPGSAAVFLAAGWHPVRLEYGFETAGPFGAELPRLDIQWRPPQATGFSPIPDNVFASHLVVERPTIAVSPLEGHDGQEFFFEVVAPTGPGWEYLWDFGDGNSAKGRAVRHTYRLASGRVQTPFLARVEVKHPDGTSAKTGKVILVSRYAGTAAYQARRAAGAEDLRLSAEKQAGWDRRSTPTPFLEMVNRARGALIEASSEFDHKFAATNLGDESYQSRWMSAKGQAEAWVRVSFGQPGAPKRHRITSYGFNLGPLRWTWQRDPAAWDIYGSNEVNPPAFSLEPGAPNPGWTRLGGETGFRHAGAEVAERLRNHAFFFSLEPPDSFAHYLFHFRNQGKELTDTVEITELMLFEKLRPASGDGERVQLEADPVSGSVPMLTTFSIPGQAEAVYDWSLGDGHSVRTREPRLSHVYRQPGNYEVKVVSRDPSVPPVMAKTQLEVRPGGPNQPPEPEVQITPQNPSAGMKVQFDARATRDPEGGRLEYIWYFGDGMSASGPAVEHVYRKPGPVDVVLHVRDAEGGMAAYSRTINIQDIVSGRGVISVNFGGPGSDFGLSLGAGAVPVGGWNHLVEERVWMDAQGREVPTKIDSQSKGTRGVVEISGDLLDGDRLMLSTGLSWGARGGWSVTILDVPYARYDVYVYPMPQGDRAPGVQAFSVGNRTLYLPARPGVWTGMHKISKAEKPEDIPADATCLLFEDVSGPSFTITTHHHSGTPRIAGIQIVERVLTEGGGPSGSAMESRKNASVAGP